MTLKVKMDWIWFFHKLRLAFLVGMFYVFYEYAAPVFAFMWIAYFILNDLNDIETTQSQEKEERHHAWKSTLSKRKGF